jgi:predicted lipoprotein with Yx(FWY)xxD motif
MPNNNPRSSAVSLTTPRQRLVAAAATLAVLAATTLLLLHPSGGSAAGSSGPIVSSAKTGLGRILVNSRGHTLYLFGKDRKGKSACTGMCATFWPPLLASGKPRAGAGVKASLFGTTRRAGGKLQVTYNHHPLYMFVKDKRKGQTNGEGINAFGGVWDAVSPAGAKVVRHPAPNPIPQHNGGDHDSDNNGGPSDGDGNI